MQIGYGQTGTSPEKSSELLYFINERDRTEMNREGQAMCFFAGANSIFAGDKLLTTPNPDVNEDMEMFKMLGLNPQKPFVKKAQPETVEATESRYQPLGEKPKWTRPGHSIPRNEEAKAKAKA